MNFSNSVLGQFLAFLYEFLRLIFIFWVYSTSFKILWFIVWIFVPEIWILWQLSLWISIRGKKKKKCMNFYGYFKFFVLLFTNFHGVVNEFHSKKWPKIQKDMQLKIIIFVVLFMNSYGIFLINFSGPINILVFQIIRFCDGLRVFFIFIFWSQNTKRHLVLQFLRLCTLYQRRSYLWAYGSHGPCIVSGLFFFKF